jgi:hypothetical protein
MPTASNAMITFRRKLFLKNRDVIRTGSAFILFSGLKVKFDRRCKCWRKNFLHNGIVRPSIKIQQIVFYTNVNTANNGIRVSVSGGPITDGPLARGSFYHPTLLEVADSRLPIVQQEVFGPVLTMQTFETEAQAIALANDSEYGLSASIWSRDADRPLRVARALQSGTVWINDWAVLRDQFEEGGFKQSGQGRMRGVAALDDFLEFKHIAFKPGTVDRDSTGAMKRG